MLDGSERLTFHRQAEEWLYFHKGQARATVFLGGALARTFDFTAGDTAVFPDNSGRCFQRYILICGSDCMSGCLADEIPPQAIMLKTRPKPKS